MPIKLNLARIDALEQLRITDLGDWNIWTKYLDKLFVDQSPQTGTDQMPKYCQKICWC